MSPIINIKNLVKRYKKAEKNAVDDISFTVNKGEFFALLGPNGAGKTTTISILITTLAKTSGEITIAGFDLDTRPSQIRQSIGVIFQSPSLDMNLTAEENIRFHCILYGLYNYHITYSMMSDGYKKRLHALSDVLGLNDEMFKPVKTFSGGMKRKLEIIRSLMHKPTVLFLDEPTSGLDPLSRRNLWEYLTQVRKQDETTIFLTTHYLEEAEGADNICIIKDGKIAAFGKPADIKRDLTQEYLLVDSIQRQSLDKELKNHKYHFTNTTPVKIFLEKKSAQQVIKTIETPLSVLKIHNPTLEEAYVDIIDQSEKEEI